ncbi:hypothetical protein MNBD_UNCLBAC01-1245 [hydrothermal vent metagenome]|uniref:Uncharacterized protein n=1 Tax=hydrothermal vent metagenome TaxID=652676 RepID=A0A3B1DIV3_9ZZZZ
MGPYVIRSWNAQVKGWEDSVIDSFNDPLTEAPSVTLPGCECTWQDEGCLIGPGCSNIKQRYFTNLCLPAGCESEMIPAPPPDKCVWDDSCCTAWSPANPAVSDCGINAIPPCPLGEARQTRQCGETLTESRCEPHPNCIFGCTEPPAKITLFEEYGDLCPGDEAGITTPTPYTYVNDNSCTGAKCEIQCIDSAVSYGMSCDCLPGMVFDIASGRCVCAAGFVKQTDPNTGISCPAQSCFQGICGANQCEQ